jgi:hypothetical protein
MRITRLSRRLQVGLLVLPFFVLGCEGGDRTPTEPAGFSKEAAVQADQAEGDVAALTGEARGGNGNGGGNGGGGNGGGNGNGGGGNGGGNGGGGRGGELAAELHPSTWNTNWEHAQGTVQVFLRGRDAGKVDLDSIELVGEGGSIEPRSARLAGGQVVAHFTKQDAIGLLNDPERGDTPTLTLEFTVDGTAKELTLRVRIVGEGGGGGGTTETNVRLDVKPDSWNVNWSNSAGTVEAFLRGTGLQNIDLDSIELLGDDAAAAPVEAVSARLSGNHILARFPKGEAFDSLDDPDPGERHEVKIRFSVEGEDGASTEKTLTDTVVIVGPAR